MNNLIHTLGNFFTAVDAGCQKQFKEQWTLGWGLHVKSRLTRALDAESTTLFTFNMAVTSALTDITLESELEHPLTLWPNGGGAEEYLYAVYKNYSDELSDILGGVLVDESMEISFDECLEAVTHQLFNADMFVQEVVDAIGL
mgnify:CR=1 FL=1